jgi:hypothetical protein
MLSFAGTTDGHMQGVACADRALNLLGERHVLWIKVRPCQDGLEIHVQDTTFRQRGRTYTRAIYHTIDAASVAALRDLFSCPWLVAPTPPEDTHHDPHRTPRSRRRTRG